MRGGETVAKLTALPRSERFHRLLLLIFTASAVVGVMSATGSNYLAPEFYEQGAVASRTVYAPRDLLIEDALSTEKSREEAVRDVKAVFSMREAPAVELRSQLEAFFVALRDAGEKKDTAKINLTNEARLALEEDFNLTFTDEEWQLLGDSTQWPALEEMVTGVLLAILEHGVISSKAPLLRELGRAGAVLREGGGRNERPLTDEKSLYSLAEAVELVKNRLAELERERGEVFAELLRKFTAMLLRPNVVYDAEETARRVEEARKSVDPVFVKVKRGEVIIRAGDQATVTQERKLRHLAEAVRGEHLAGNLAGYFVVTAIVLLSVCVFVANFWPRFQLANRDLSLVAMTLIGSFALLRVFSIFSNALSYSFPDVDSGTFVLATPVAVGGILLQVILGGSAVLMFVMAFGLLSALFVSNPVTLLYLIVVGNTVAALSVQRCSRRSAFISAGVRTASINVLVVLCLLIIFPSFSTSDGTWRILWALSGGLLSGILASGIAPLAEHYGRYTTDIKLLELASLDHPLLRELSVQAPGTWNHSMVMGHISEAAAEAIGANSLLARVGAYYHDIGKIKKPIYFYENQADRENRHDKLTPSMSALIIRKHVKDGIDLANQHRLPQVITDFIPQHHGTCLMEYFYDKAKKEAEEDETVEESHYRYAGPKPQSREAGILMLADQVEAAARTLSDPSPAKIQGLVQKIINKVFASAQLDESNLTLRDLHLIAKAFTRVLTGIYHRRVEYAEPAEKVREARAGKEARSGQEPQQEGASEGSEKGSATGVRKNGDRHPGEAAAGKGAQESGSKKGPENDSKDALKRLGM